MAHALAGHQDHDNTDVFGFWIYILSDCLLFATLFSVYAVLCTSTYGGASLKELIKLPDVFLETLALLCSSFTFGLAILSRYKNKIKSTIFWLLSTLALGAIFLSMELNEFIHLTLEGHSWQSNAAMSAFFTLVGTHGFHVFLGSLWMLVLVSQIFIFGLTPAITRRLTYLGLFWAFLDIVWIFVFTIVYLMGAI
jgi:cytochrome o ubiquinol oxidase subunit III